MAGAPNQEAWMEKVSEKEAQMAPQGSSSNLGAPAAEDQPPPSYDEVRRDPPRRPPPPGATRVLPPEGAMFAPPVPTRVSVSEPSLAEPSRVSTAELPSPSPSQQQPEHLQSSPPLTEGTTIVIPPGSSMTVSVSSSSLPSSSQPAPVHVQTPASRPSSQILQHHVEPLMCMDFPVGTLRTQLQNANSWLQDNAHYQPVSVETVEIPRENEGVNFGDSSSINNVTNCSLRLASNVQYIRYLRVWLTPRTPNSSPVMQINYTDVVPLVKKSRKFAFEDMKETVDKFNTKLSKIPLNGHILNVQTLRLMFKDKGNPQPEKFEENFFTWIREGDDSPEYYYLTFLRVYYFVNSDALKGAVGQLRYMDFPPMQDEESKSNKDFEKFSRPLTRAQSFILQNQQDKRFINVQTVDHMFSKSPGSKFEAKTHKTLLKETDTGDIRRLKFVRLFYEEILHVDGSFSPTVRQIFLTYKTFCPEMTARPTKTSPPAYETAKETWMRASAWLKVTGVQVIGAELISIKSFPSNKNPVYGDHEECFVNHRPDWQEFNLFAIRVYINGTFSEPPSHLLPARPLMPTQAETKSCVIQ